MTTSQQAKPRWVKEVKEWTVSLGVALVVSLLIQQYAFAQVKVEQHSMETTLQPGNRMLENRLLYRFSDPQRGDIVIINGPEYEKRLIKRVIGLPGDVLDIRNGTVYVNGEPLEEPYVNGGTKAGTIQLPLTIPENSYFVMGDNRGGSLDSRDLGVIRSSSIEGKAVFRLWPLSF